MFTFSGEFAQGLNVQGREMRLCLNPVIHFLNTGSLMFACQSLETGLETAKECAKLSLKMIHKKNTTRVSAPLRIQESSMHQLSS